MVCLCGYPARNCPAESEEYDNVLLISGYICADSDSIAFLTEFLEELIYVRP